jgi:hypothetical protein
VDGPGTSGYLSTGQGGFSKLLSAGRFPQGRLHTALDSTQTLVLLGFFDLSTENGVLYYGYEFESVNS